METILIKAAQLILAFAILVIIHEFGHFLFARIFGIRVEKFYIFFNPWMSIAKWKPKKYLTIFGRKKKLSGYTEEDEKAEAGVSEVTAEADDGKKLPFWTDTEYGIGWLPLGGYCKIAGMIDESMDTKQMKSEPKSWEFRTKPAWQRLLVMVAGVLFNFLLAIVIYAGIVYCTGEKYVPFKEAKMGMVFSDAAKKVGFRDGDILLEADGNSLDYPPEARMKVMEAKTVKVLRGTDTVSVRIPSNFIFRLDEELKRDDTKIAFFAYRIPAEITQVANGEPAAKAGMQVGDRFVAINDTLTESLDQFFVRLEGHGNQDVRFTLARPNAAGAYDTIQTVAHLTDGSKLGIGLQVDPSAFFKTYEKQYNLLTSIPRGVTMGVEQLTSYAGSMKHVFSKEGAQSIGGFGAIGSIFPESWNWLAFWNIAAFLSVALAFMNILPIPALDGGHVLFLLYEVITRRKPSEKFMEYAQMVGMGLLILLLVYANGMDIVRLFK